MDPDPDRMQKLEQLGFEWSCYDSKRKIDTKGPLRSFVPFYRSWMIGLFGPRWSWELSSWNKAVALIATIRNQIGKLVESDGSKPNRDNFWSYRQRFRLRRSKGTQADMRRQSRSSSIATADSPPSNDNVIALITIRFVRFSRLNLYTSITRLCPGQPVTAEFFCDDKATEHLFKIYPPRVNWSTLGATTVLSTARSPNRDTPHNESNPTRRHLFLEIPHSSISLDGVRSTLASASWETCRRRSRTS
jgi:hypothetical protein